MIYTQQFETYGGERISEEITKMNPEKVVSLIDDEDSLREFEDYAMVDEVAVKDRYALRTFKICPDLVRDLDRRLIVKIGYYMPIEQGYDPFFMLGAYMKQHENLAETFHVFTRDDQTYAMYVVKNNEIRIMTLPECEDVGACVPVRGDVDGVIVKGVDGFVSYVRRDTGRRMLSHVKVTDIENPIITWKIEDHVLPITGSIESHVKLMKDSQGIHVRANTYNTYRL